MSIKKLELMKNYKTHLSKQISVFLVEIEVDSEI
jgi:hypothetical protein